MNKITDIDLIGGSRSSGFIKKLIAENNINLTKIRNPSDDLKKRFSYRRPVDQLFSDAYSNLEQRSVQNQKELDDLFKPYLRL